MHSQIEAVVIGDEIDRQAQVSKATGAPNLSVADSIFQRRILALDNAAEGHAETLYSVLVHQWASPHNSKLTLCR